MIKNNRTIAVLVITLSLVTLAVSQDNLANWRVQLTEKSEQIRNIDAQIVEAQEQHQRAVSDHETAKNEVETAKISYNRAKDAYERGTANPDIIPPDTLINLLNTYKNADNRYRESLENEKQIGDRRKSLESQIESLVDQKSDIEIEILEIKATMFDDEMSRPVWSEGYGESILDENKTMNECKEMALSYAERDAIEKGGKAIIQAVTEIEDFQLIKDRVKSQANVQVIERA